MGNGIASNVVSEATGPTDATLPACGRCVPELQSESDCRSYAT